MPFASITGVDLYYEDHGSGPALVFAHGGGHDHIFWWQQTEVFARHHRVIVFDHRGHGLSPDTDGRGPAAFTDDLVALLDFLHIERAALVGHSMGGVTVAGVASQHPERVSALVLSDTPGGIHTPEVLEMQRSLPEWPSPELFALIEERTFHEEQPALATLYDQLVMRLALLRLPPWPDLIESVARIQNEPGPIVEHGIPTMIMVGAVDLLVPPRVLRSLLTVLPHAHFVEITGAGHHPFFEKAHESNEVLRSFLDGVVPTHR